ncbi:MAG: ATP-dependent DNA helicase [Desulfobacterales bacterium]|nr:ATP-dependent DNA helicase [Desulfobacterales bacterium]
MSALRKLLDQIFAPDGLLAGRLPHYEFRPGQQRMAGAVAKTLAGPHGRMLAVEAETGIGKTLAYLVPAVLSGQRVVISTNTLNLQEQILKREIPFIRQHIDPTLTALCVKGRQNYLCLHRFHQTAATPQQRLFAQDTTLAAISEWLEETETGDRAELTWLADSSPLWPEISASTSQCLGSRCPVESECFVTRLRKKAAASRLLIVNHHLFFADLALRRTGFGEVLPRYESMIFDEAHHLESVATTHFGASFSQYQLLDLIRDLERLAGDGPDGRGRERLIQATRALAKQTERFAALFPRDKGRFGLAELIAREPDWTPTLLELRSHLQRLGERIKGIAASGDLWPAMEQRCGELLHRLDITTQAPDRDQDDSFIRWGERRDRSVALIASPVDIAELLQQSLYDTVKSGIFTSATLSTGNSFAYFLQRLGLESDTETLSLASPFDHARRTLLYVPDSGRAGRFPEPGDPGFPKAARAQIEKLLLASQGRALVLFTSLAAMAACHRFLEGRLPYPLLVQGQAPKNVLLESFQRETLSVLLAVASFWEGVDVPGESLSCVIIDKLPFEVPSDPVIMARINRIKEEGGNPFFELQVPRAILALRQGVGRLLRSASDQGLLAILDVRLFSRGYGRLFRAGLPPSPLTRSLEEARDFFKP